MRQEDIQPDAAHCDMDLEQALDRLGSLVVLESAAEEDFVSRVMLHIGRAAVGGTSPSLRRAWFRGSPRPSQAQGRATEARRKHPSGRTLVRVAIGAAVCLAVALAIWRATAARPVPPAVVETDRREEKVAVVAPPANALSVNPPSAQAAPAKETAPVQRTSTWSVVNECVVLEGDVPVRKLLYREFERVELIDRQGNTESQLVVPTKALLVASKELY